MSLSRHLILSQSDWESFLSNRRVIGSAYACIFIGYILLFVNDGIYLTSGELSTHSVYAIIILAILTSLAIGIYKKKFYSIPIAVIGINIAYIFANLQYTFISNEIINVITISYSVMYYIINSLIFRLKAVFIFNLGVFSTVSICAAHSIYLNDVAESPPAQSLIANALILSAAGLLLQHLVLTVRAMLIEQLGSVKLRMAALEAEMKIENAKKEVREKTARLNRISAVEALGASIAHEINQPIAAALTYCKAARNWAAIECQNAPETLLALSGVESNVDRAARLIDNIRLLTTNKDRTYALTNVRELVKDQVDLLHAEFERRGITLLFAPSSDETKAVVCAPEIALATINLLRNAMEAFDGLKEDAVVSVDCRRSGPDWIEIQVIDNGKGLSPEGIQNAFGAFQTTKETGVGIGLSICQEVAEHHAGSISLTANLTGGLTAALRLAHDPLPQ